MDELFLKISDEMNLNAYETEMLIHDVHNLRGDEWIEDIKERCSRATSKRFQATINSLQRRTQADGKQI